MTDRHELTALLTDLAREHGWDLEWDYQYGEGTADDPCAYTVYVGQIETPAEVKP